MSVDLHAIHEDRPEPPGLTIERIANEQGLAVAADLAGATFGLVPEKRPRYLAVFSVLGFAEDAPFQSYVGSVDGTPVAVSQSFLGADVVGIYTVANSQTEGLWIIADSVAIVLLTNITAGDEENRARMTPVVCRNTLLVTGVAAVGAAIIAGIWIPVVFGADYQDSVAPYLWLLPGTVAIAGAKILASYVFARGRPIINAWIALTSLVVTTPVTVVLLLAFGVAGAAAATSLSYVLTLALTAYAYRSLSGNSMREALVPQRSDIALYVDAARSGLRRLRRRAQALDETPR